MDPEFKAELIETKDGIILKGVSIKMLEGNWVEVKDQRGSQYLVPKDQVVRIRKK